MIKIPRTIAAIGFSIACTGLAQAGLGDWLNILTTGSQAPESTGVTPSTVVDLTQGEMTDGLKQALDSGVQHAVQQLGQPGGFLNDARVRIPMPDKLAWVEKTLRSVGKDDVADEFVNSMNHAAELAVPEVVSVFEETIRGMTLQDARGILQGPDDAATRYFRENSSTALIERMRPIVTQATDNAGVTSRYKTMMSKAGNLASLLGQETVDLDSYVTDKALDGLFVMIAEQEKKIRENPLERSTKLLQKVFGSI